MEQVEAVNMALSFCWLASVWIQNDLEKLEKANAGTVNIGSFGAS